MEWHSRKPSAKRRDGVEGLLSLEQLPAVLPAVPRCSTSRAFFSVLFATPRVYQFIAQEMFHHCRAVLNHGEASRRFLFVCTNVPTPPFVTIEISNTSRARFQFWFGHVHLKIAHKSIKIFSETEYSRNLILADPLFEPSGQHIMRRAALSPREVIKIQCIAFIQWDRIQFVKCENKKKEELKESSMRRRCSSLQISHFCASTDVCTLNSRRLGCPAKLGGTSSDHWNSLKSYW